MKYLVSMATLDSSYIQAAMQKWNTMLTVNGQVLEEVHIRRGIFQGDSLSPLLFVITMRPLPVILRKIGLGYQTSKMAAKISHLLYMDDFKLYSKTEAALESLQHRQNIQQRYKHGLWIRKMCHSHSTPRSKTNTSHWTT